MGGIASRRTAGVEEVDISASNAYRYPPKSGCYFGSHFFMGGQRFDIMQPEAYLFGPNSDLNFLGNRPSPFPYPAPQPNEPTKTLKSLVNIRKDSIRFVKAEEDLPEKKSETEEPEDQSKEDNEGDADEEADKEESPVPAAEKHRYNIEFTFDTDVRCAITIFYFATEEIASGHAVYHPRDASMNSETYHYKRGANQIFSQSMHVIVPEENEEEEWQYNVDKEVIPIVIQCAVEEEEYIGHSHMTFASVDHASDGGYMIKPLKQKQMVDGLCYLLQEIYGIENKACAAPKDDDYDDNGSECIVCMSDVRDTLILPCRHLCLCNNCADSLRYQANNCPICRKTFHALLQIRALKKKAQGAVQTPSPAEGEDNGISQEGVPPGYEAVALLDALNGTSTPPQATVPPDGDNPNLDKLLGLGHATRPSHLSSGEESPDLKRNTKRSSSTKSRETNPVSPDEERMGTPEMAMNADIPEARKEKEEKSPDAKSPTEAGKDKAHIVNELMTKKSEKLRVNTRSETPPPDYEEVEGDTPPKPAAHATVMYDRPEDRDETPPEEVLPLVSLPSQVLDSDLPAADSSGSSYSSTSSTKLNHS